MPDLIEDPTKVTGSFGVLLSLQQAGHTGPFVEYITYQFERHSEMLRF